jgi:dipeptidyl aminopeptidase/acylaminoacyl peptidase
MSWTSAGENHMKTCLRTLAAAAALAWLPAVSYSSPLELSQYLNWERVAGPQIAPDGKTIVYSRGHVNAKEDRFDDALWIMDGDGSRNRYLTDGSQAVWSADGRRIAFLRAAGGGAEIFTRWMDTSGATTQLTYADLKPTNVHWSPDGKWIAFRGVVPRQSQWTIALPARPSGANWTADATVIDTWHYRMDRIGLTAAYRHIFVVPAEGGTPRQITRGEWNVGARVAGIDMTDPFEWTPDGKSIVFSADMEADHDRNFRRSALYAVDVGSGATHKLSKEAGFWGGFIAGPRVSPNGKLVAVAGNKPSRAHFAVQELRVVSTGDTGERTLISDLPGYVYSLHWARDGRGVYYVVEEAGARNLHYVSLDGKARAVTTGAQALSVDAISDTAVAVGTKSTPDRPQDIVRFKLDHGDDIQFLTAVNDDILSGVELGKVEEIWYDSSDRTRVQGWIVYPPAFDPAKKYPLLLFIHGGPESMFDVSFSFHFQELAAAAGYVILYTNPRGSTGYGTAFAQAIDSEFPGRRDMDDLMHGVDAVIQRGSIDSERLYVAGGSGGGSLTAWIVGHTDRFAAAASYFPVIDWIGFAGTTDVTSWGYNRFSEDFWKNPQRWLEHSPLMYAPNVKTPTLLVTGEDDMRTPLGQSEQFYSALKYHDVPTKLVVIKNEGHGVGSRPSNLMRSQLYMRKWLSSWRRVQQPDGPAWVTAAKE